MLRKLAGLNTKTMLNCLHISLNFDPSENIAENKLREITREYMDQLGFGNQPYLVYQHFDAGHPHLHIVTTNIQADSTRIDLHHLALRKSEPARKNIEQQHKLIRAENQKTDSYTPQPVIPQKVNYGKSQTKKAIAIVLKSVINSYMYTSLPELNAILKQYNVHADQGTKDSRIYKNNGLIYRVLGPLGNPVGVPIKSSLFSSKVTLKYLHSHFKTNELKRHKYKSNLKNAIDKIFIKEKKISLESFNNQLKVIGINLVLRKNDHGIIFGITYIDHQTKCVFNGSALGKKYSANAILERCIDPIHRKVNPVDKEAIKDKSIHIKPSFLIYPIETTPINKHVILPIGESRSNNLIALLLEPEHTYEPSFWPLKPKRKKKKRKPNTESK